MYHFSAFLPLFSLLFALTFWKTHTLTIIEEHQELYNPPNLNPIPFCIYIQLLPYFSAPLVFFLIAKIFVHDSWSQKIYSLNRFVPLRCHHLRDRGNGQIMCFVLLQSQVQQRFEGCRYFPLTETKETPFKLFFFLCVYVCVCTQATGARAEQTKTQSRANQHSVLEVSSKEATQSVV